MKLTPKNWNSFQHYKDRSPAWIKLHRGLLDDFTFNRLPLASRALAPMLWLLASEYEGGEIAANVEEIAFRLRASVDDVRGALSPLINAGFFIASEQLADCKPDACLEEEREKEVEEERETESRVVAEATHPRQPDRFDEFWRAYPRRDGANPRAPAEKKFKALVKSGIDPQVMIAGAAALAFAESKKGNIGTSFVPQAMTWLNQQRWSDHSEVAGLLAPATPEMQIDEAVKMYARLRRWSHHAGPEPGMTGCRASPELMAKYGMQPDGRKIEPSPSNA